MPESLQHRIATGRITMRDVENHIHSEWQARRNGYVMDTYSELVRMRRNLVMIFGNGDEAYALMQFSEREDNYLQRIINTIERMDEFIEQYNSEPQMEPTHA